MQYQMKDCKLETFGLFADYYQHIGDKQRHDIFRERFLLLKDTLANYRQLTSVNEMEFEQELKGMTCQTYPRHHREQRRGVLDRFFH